MLRMLQALVHIVTVNRYENFTDQTNRENISTRKLFTQIIFNVKISRSMVMSYYDSYIPPWGDLAHVTL